MNTSSHQLDCFCPPTRLYLPLPNGALRSESPSHGKQRQQCHKEKHNEHWAQTTQCTIAIVPLRCLCHAHVTPSKMRKCHFSIPFHLQPYHHILTPQPHHYCFPTTDILQQIPSKMSLIPTLSNELSPHPRIHIGEIPSNATALKQRPTSPRLRRDSNQRFRSNSSTVRSRGRSGSNAECVPAKSQARERSTSFASTQNFHDGFGSIPVPRLDHKVSERKVQELLKLRNRKLKEAERRGDEIEVFRLKNLNLVEEIERPEIAENEPEVVGFRGDIASHNDHQDCAPQIEVVDVGFTSQPKSVNQEHTATLCWHLKLEYAQGLRVPDEFSKCTIHPSPSPCASSSPSFVSQPSSPSSRSPGSRRSLRRTKLSSIGSSTLRDFSEPSSPATSPSTAIGSEPSSPSFLGSESKRSLRHTKLSSNGTYTLREFSEPSSPATSSSTAIGLELSSPTQHSSISTYPDEEDPFLYVARDITTHPDGNNQVAEAKRSDYQPPSADANPSFHEHSSNVSYPDEEDPFLYIARDIRTQAEGDNSIKKAKRSDTQAPIADAKCSFHIKCTCTNHNCLTYLSGPPSKHCRFCKLPRLQPEIAAAIDRIEDIKTSVLALADANLPQAESSAAEEYGTFEVLQEDMELVEMYNAETEKRCRNGVWWEGWLIAEDLKRQGVVGSKPFVCATDSSAA